MTETPKEERMVVRPQMIIQGRTFNFVPIPYPEKTHWATAEDILSIRHFTWRSEDGREFSAHGDGRYTKVKPLDEMGISYSAFIPVKDVDPEALLGAAKRVLQAQHDAPSLKVEKWQFWESSNEYGKEVHLQAPRDKNVPMEEVLDAKASVHIEAAGGGVNVTVGVRQHHGFKALIRDGRKVGAEGLGKYTEKLVGELKDKAEVEAIIIQAHREAGFAGQKEKFYGIEVEWNEKEKFYFGEEKLANGRRPVYHHINPWTDSFFHNQRIIWYMDLPAGTRAIPFLWDDINKEVHLTAFMIKESGPALHTDADLEKWKKAMQEFVTKESVRNNLDLR